MKIFNFLIYGLLVALLMKFDLLDRRPLRGFVNLPFEKQMPYYPEFQKFINSYRGKINFIQLYHGNEPYGVFTKNFFPNATDAEVVNFAKLKKEEILEVFVKRGFEMTDLKNNN
jgi:hypothetical protein